MAWNGSGVFNRLYNWVSDKALGIPITASRVDGEFDNYKAGLENCLTRDGQTVPSANLSMNSFKLTNIANGVNTGDAANFGQLSTVKSDLQTAIQNNSYTWCGTSGGTANAITLTPSPAIAAYVAGMSFIFIPANSNTTAATGAVSGLPAKNIKKASISGKVALNTNDITAGVPVVLLYDGTDLVLETPMPINDMVIYGGTDTGTGATYIVNPTIPVTLYKDGQIVIFSAANTNSLAAPTLNVSSLGAGTIVKNGNFGSGYSLLLGDIFQGALVVCIRSGSNWLLLNPVTPGGDIAFKAHLAANTTNQTGDGTLYAPIITQVDFNNNGSGSGGYNAGTGEYTIPATGYWKFNIRLQLQGLTAAHTTAVLSISQGGGATIRELVRMNIGAVRDATNKATISCSFDLLLNTGAVLIPTITVSGGTKVVGLIGSNTLEESTWSGRLDKRS